MRSRSMRPAARLLALGLLTAALAALPAGVAEAHYDGACYAQANGTPYLINAGTIGASGYGACENSTGHINHAYICAETWVQAYTGGSWQYYPDEGARSCIQWASHVGDSGSSLRWCEDGGDRSRSYRTATKFTAYNQDLTIVHTKWGYSGARTLTC